MMLIMLNNNRVNFKAPPLFHALGSLAINIKKPVLRAVRVRCNLSILSFVTKHRKKWSTQKSKVYFDLWYL
jgi:hypothetical protein